MEGLGRWGCRLPGGRPSASRVRTAVVRVVASGCLPGGFLCVRDVVERVLPPDPPLRSKNWASRLVGRRRHDRPRTLTGCSYGIGSYRICLLGNDGGRFGGGKGECGTVARGSVNQIPLCTFDRPG